MIRLFDMIMIHVRNVPYLAKIIVVPHVRRILSKRITGQLALSRPFKMLFVRIFGWHANVVQIEFVVIRFGIPKHDFVATAESLLAVQAVPEVPDYPVPKLETELLEDRAQLKIKRNDMPVAHIVSHLPTDA